MFLMVSESKCPFCGIQGREWKKRPKVLLCPNCNALFNHFGIVLEGKKEEQELA